ncbi:MAG: hypothetical protein AAF228_05005 [Pseudomonadota bacterium]
MNTQQLDNKLNDVLKTIADSIRNEAIENVQGRSFFKEQKQDIIASLQVKQDPLKHSILVASEDMTNDTASWLKQAARDMLPKLRQSIRRLLQSKNIISR